MCFSASKISYFEDIVSLDSAIQVLKGCKVALQFAPIPGIAAAVEVGDDDDAFFVVVVVEEPSVIKILASVRRARWDS